MKIAVFCPNLIGDTVMATPTFRALRQGFPGATIVGVIKPTGGADARRQRRGSTTGSISTANRATASSGPSAYCAGCAANGSTWRFSCPIRFDRPGSPGWPASRDGLAMSVTGVGCLLTDRLYHPRDAVGRLIPTPIVETYLGLARQVGCQVDSVRIELATTAEDEAAADRAFAVSGIGRTTRRIVCLNTGGAFGPAKSWPVAAFRRRWRGDWPTQAGVSILVLCGPDEREPAREIVPAAGHPHVVSLADQPLGIGLTKACVRRSALMITTDSGPRHFAAAFNTPVITLVRTDSHRLDSHLSSSCVAYTSSGTVRTVPAAGLPGRPSSVYARPVAGERFPGGPARVGRDGANRLRTASLGGVKHGGLAGDGSDGLCGTARSRCARARRRWSSRLPKTR